MRTIIILCLSVVFSGCETLENPYKKFYKKVPENMENVILLQNGEKPDIYIGRYMKGIHVSGDDIQNIKATLGVNGYIPIGYSHFNIGFSQDKKSLTKYAREIGASVVVLYYELAGANSSYVPSTTTIQHSGTIGNGTIDNSTYSGTSTTTTNKLVTTFRYNQYATFFAKAIKNKKLIGVVLANLSERDKQTNSRNTGAVISGVGNKSPAFYANLIKGDVIIKINDQEVLEVSMAMKLIANAINDDSIKLTILRYGREKNIIVNMNK